MPWSIRLAIRWRAYDSAVDHGVFIVRVGGQHLEHLLPYAALRPARKSGVNLDRVAKTFRQIPPRHAGAIKIEKGFYKQPIIPVRSADVTLTSRQNIREPVPLIVAKGAQG